MLYLNRYFTDPDVLHRIPSLFYLLGGLFLSLQTIAFYLIREPSEGESKELSSFISSTKEDQNEETYPDSDRTAKLVENEENEQFSLKPKEVLQTKEFYLVRAWASHTHSCTLLGPVLGLFSCRPFHLLSLWPGNGFFSDYSKVFGQI